MNPLHDPSTVDPLPLTKSSFEDELRRLAHIVDQLEQGELPLDESLELFAAGVKLAKAAQAKLEAAERRVEELLGIGADGNPIVREIEGE